MISPDEALRALSGAALPLAAEPVPLEEALGRIVSGPLHARADFPAFAQSAMDGYAVHAADLAGATAGAPVRLPRAGAVKAGDRHAAALLRGTTSRIFTGAMVPAGADAVVMQEHVRVDGDAVLFAGPVAVGANVRTVASDTRRGELLLPVGAELGPGELGLLASQQVGVIEAFRRPRVAIVTTGDELRPLEAALAPGEIVNSNAHSLAALVSDAGGVPWVLPPARDDDASTLAALETSLAGADLVLTVGGISVGDHDRVHAALAALGARVHFTKVAMKPGKPLTLASAGDKPIVGLPGNPVSAAVAFEAFVRPAVRRLQGDAAPYVALAPVVVATEYQRSTGRLEFARARLRPEERQFPHAELHAKQNSGSLRSLVDVDALVVIPAERAVVRPGDVLMALPLRGRGVRTPVAPSFSA